MMRGVMGQKIVARLNWGAFDHASHAPQLSLATITCIFLGGRDSHHHYHIQSFPRKRLADRDSKLVHLDPVACWSSLASVCVPEALR